MSNAHAKCRPFFSNRTWTEIECLGVVLAFFSVDNSNVNCVLYNVRKRLDRILDYDYQPLKVKGVIESIITFLTSIKLYERDCKQYENKMDEYGKIFFDYILFLFPFIKENVCTLVQDGNMSSYNNAYHNVLLQFSEPRRVCNEMAGHRYFCHSLDVLTCLNDFVLRLYNIVHHPEDAYECFPESAETYVGVLWYHLCEVYFFSIDSSCAERLCETFKDRIVECKENLETLPKYATLKAKYNEQNRESSKSYGGMKI